MAAGDLGDIVVYGSTAWDQPWLTEHHLARALARGHRVLFVDSPRTLLSPLRAGVNAAALREAARLTGDRLRREGDLHVLGVLSLPPASDPRARRLSASWMRRQVRGALARLGMRPRVLITARGLDPGGEAIAQPFVVSLVKDWLQAGGHLTGLDATALRERELAAWRRADLVCAISRRLQERLAQEGIAGELLRHGADAALVARADARAAPGLAAYSRPRLGCVGRVDGRWAFDALGALADRHPEGSVLLIGPVSPRVPRPALDALLARPNVHAVAPVPSAELPGWLAGLDCCLVPYLDDEWQRYASPLKVWDYLASGVPIVATGAPALGEFPPGLIHFGLEPARLGDLVDDALAEDRPATAAARRRYAQRNTWDHRAAQLSALIAERQGAAPPPVAPPSATPAASRS